MLQVKLGDRGPHYDYTISLKLLPHEKKSMMDLFYRKYVEDEYITKYSIPIWALSACIVVLEIIIAILVPLNLPQGQGTTITTIWPAYLLIFAITAAITVLLICGAIQLGKCNAEKELRTINDLWFHITEYGNLGLKRHPRSYYTDIDIGKLSNNQLDGFRSTELSFKTMKNLGKILEDKGAAEKMLRSVQPILTLPERVWRNYEFQEKIYPRLALLTKAIAVEVMWNKAQTLENILDSVEGQQLINNRNETVENARRATSNLSIEIGQLITDALKEYNAEPLEEIETYLKTNQTTPIEVPPPEPGKPSTGKRKILIS